MTYQAKHDLNCYEQFIIEPKLYNVKNSFMKIINRYFSLLIPRLQSLGAVIQKRSMKLLKLPKGQRMLSHR